MNFVTTKTCGTRCKLHLSTTNTGHQQHLSGISPDSGSGGAKEKKFTFGEQFLEGVPGQGATDLQPLRHNSRGDELVIGNFFVQLVVGGLVEEDQVVELIPHFSLGPLLLRINKMCSIED